MISNPGRIEAKQHPPTSALHYARRLKFWTDRLPLLVAEMQVALERREGVLRMRRAGLNYREIGERLGVSATRARQLIDRADRDRDKSPVQKFFDDGRDIEKLAGPTHKDDDLLRDVCAASRETRTDFSERK